MKAREHISQLQAALLIPVALRAPHIGPLTKDAFTRLSLLGPDEDFQPVSIGIPVGQGQDLSQPGEANARDISDKAAQLIQSFEGLYLKAYDDGGGVMTIGWGHTGLQHNDGTVYPGRVITLDKAKQLFRYDMEQFEARVSHFVKVPLNDDEYGAMVSFDFNTGAIDKASLTKKLNAGDRQGAADGLLEWSHDNGRELPGLLRRRKAERKLFLTGQLDLS